MSLTESEAIFEEFCVANGIPVERIPSGADRTPDYLIKPSGIQIACEVKQIELNRKEKTALAAVLRGEVVVTGGTPGTRVRNAIDRAAPQLRRFTRGKYPAVLVLWEDSLIPRHTDSYNVRVAMYGLDTLVMSVPADPKKSPFLKDMKSGPKRKVTEKHNTSLSAIAVVQRNRDGVLTCRVFHNSFAGAPLPRELLANNHIRHFRLREKNPGRFDDWIEF